MRIATGQEVLVARVLTQGGRVGYGFSLQLDATAARHMAEWAAGLREWQSEAAFAKIRWIPEQGESRWER